MNDNRNVFLFNASNKDISGFYFFSETLKRSQRPTGQLSTSDRPKRSDEPKAESGEGLEEG